MDMRIHEVTSEKLDSRNTPSQALKHIDIFDRHAPFSRLDLGGYGRLVTRVVFGALWVGLLTSLLVFLRAITG